MEASVGAEGIAITPGCLVFEFMSQACIELVFKTYNG
jgi:hypothetical protein